MILGFIRRVFSLAVFLVCGWFLFTFGLSEINSQALEKGTEAPFLQYQDDSERLSSDALVLQAQKLAKESPERSVKLAITAFRKDPSNGRAATHLLTLYERQGRVENADKVAKLAGRLWPAHNYTRANLAEYWILRYRPDKVVDEWNVLLTQNRSLGRNLYPLMFKMIERDDLAPFILPFAQNPPKWWDAFFGYISSRLDIDKLEEVYRLRVASDKPLSAYEKNSYIRRLIKERRWEDAHDTWFIGLTPRQMRYSGLVYDGGFEGDIFNQGFGWKLSRSKNPRVKPDITYGISGRKALQITLRKQKPINFRHVWQHTFLTAGNYELTMRYRTDTLKTAKGLSWRLRCVESGTEVLGESIPLLGSNPWSNLKMSFIVPESCSVQMLRLEAVSRFRHHHYFQGNVWFDDIKINAVDMQDAVQ